MRHCVKNSYKLNAKCDIIHILVDIPTFWMVFVFQPRWLHADCARATIANRPHEFLVWLFVYTVQGMG